MKKPIILCDFDGTITKRDNILSIMKKFAPPEWERLKDDILASNISIQKGVGDMFRLIPSYEKYQLIEYALSHAELREGFHEFVSYTKEVDIPLYVVSGGMDFFVKPILKSLIPDDHIFCNEADFSGDFVTVHWPHACDDACQNECGCCKPSILRKLKEEDHEVIVIGDSITDFQVATMADVVFARDFLIEKCTEEGISFQPFESFFDIVKSLKKRQVVNV
ncbi:2-hydroxy-3-keto-5-methylthiopentenyl-1-phosphate phosphatase [Bacillus kexueae]|uniref:2-hydroxy-3-keto-5-methylthiopentenyl-1- phosphate phosphatase n=1 Tax=Aeribacillus kexueae TaxID=2078952 RepID=UPI001FB04154|nr:2-hydroxy-3-keto-5-methylthiopentenyl-1-phosphate phosphatase [Bacillus kexueae]